MLCSILQPLDSLCIDQIAHGNLSPHTTATHFIEPNTREEFDWGCIVLSDLCDEFFNS